MEYIYILLATIIVLQVVLSIRQKNLNSRVQIVHSGLRGATDMLDDLYKKQFGKSYVEAKIEKLAESLDERTGGTSFGDLFKEVQRGAEKMKKGEKDGKS